MKRPHYHWLAIGLACITGYAQAHGDMEKIQDALSAPNGGRLRLSGQYYIELVAQPRQLTVHAMHADTKVHRSIWLRPVARPSCYWMARRRLSILHPQVRS
jgi:hypothetical protein